MICRLKTTGAAAACLNSFPDLLKPDVKFEDLRKILQKRFGTKIDPERYLLSLNTIKQLPGESVLAFADRCRALRLKTLPGEMGPEESQWARDQMARTVQAAFIRGLRGEAPTQLQYYPPKSLKEAISRAERIEEVQALTKTTRPAFSVETDGDVDVNTTQLVQA